MNVLSTESNGANARFEASAGLVSGGRVFTFGIFVLALPLSIIAR